MQEEPFVASLFDAMSAVLILAIDRIDEAVMHLEWLPQYEKVKQVIEPMADQVKLALNFDILIRIFQVCTLDSTDYLGKIDQRRQMWEETYNNLMALNGAFDESYIPQLLYAVCMTSPGGVGFELLFEQHDYILRKLLDCLAHFWSSDDKLQKAAQAFGNEEEGKTVFPLINKKMFRVCE